MEGVTIGSVLLTVAAVAGAIKALPSILRELRHLLETLDKRRANKQ